MARGSSAEHAMVRIEGRVADCRARARVVAVTQGERLRLNDRIELVQSCASSSERERHLSSMLNGLRSGSIARLYIGYDGGLRFLNPVTAAP